MTFKHNLLLLGQIEIANIDANENPSQLNGYQHVFFDSFPTLAQLDIFQ